MSKVKFSYLRDPLNKSSDGYMILRGGPADPMPELRRRWNQLKMVSRKKRERLPIESRDKFHVLTQASSRLELDILYYAFPEIVSGGDVE